MNFSIFTTEKLLEYLSPEGLNRALHIANLQDILMALDISNIESISDTLIKSIFMRDLELIARLIDNIFICCKYREFYVDKYAFLLYILDQTIQNATRIQSSVKLGFQTKENVDQSIFTYRYLLNNDRKCKIFLEQKQGNNIHPNEDSMARRKSIILSENNNKTDLNSEETQIYSMINMESSQTNDEQKEEETKMNENKNDQEFDLFFENFIMKSDLILKEFRDRIFGINQAVTRQPWRLFAIYKCFEVFNENYFFKYISDYFNNSIVIDIDQLTVFAFFAPMIKSHSPKLFERLYNEMKNKHFYSRLPYSFKDFYLKFEESNKNDWKDHRQIVDNCGFCVGTPLYAIRHDDVDYFIEQKRKQNAEVIDYNMVIRNNVFLRFHQLTFKCTLLQLAAYYGSEKCFDFLLENGANPSIVDDIGLNTIHFAVVGGSLAIIRKLQKLGFLFDIGAISLVAECYRFDLFQWLISVSNVSLEESSLATGTIIHRAASANNILILLFCISNGANINIFDNLNLTPLFYAASNRSIDAINLLLSHKNINWSLADKFIDTPLHGAAKSGDCDTFIAMLNHKDADINVKDFRGRSAFYYAISENMYDIVQMHISKYADEIDLNEQDIYGRLHLFDVSMSGALSTFIIACNCEKFDINIVQNDGVYLLHFIVMPNSIEYVKHFIKQERADPNVRLPDGTTALHIASQKNYIEIVKLLIDNKKTDVNAVDEQGMAPIHYAIKKLHIEVVKALLSCERVDRNQIYSGISFF